MRILTVAFGLLVSIVLIGVGVPRVVASLLKAPAIATVLDAHGGDPLTIDQLDRAARYLRRASKWENSASVRTDLGFLLLLHAEKLDQEDPTRAGLIEEAVDALRDGLERAPVRPHAWVRLAYAEMLKPGPSAEVASLLEQSLTAGRFIGEISVFRIDLLLQNWEHLSFEMRKAVGAQMRYAWEHRSQMLIEVAKRTGREQVLRFAVRSIPGAIDQINASLPNG